MELTRITWSLGYVLKHQFVSTLHVVGVRESVFSEHERIRYYAVARPSVVCLSLCITLIRAPCSDG